MLWLVEAMVVCETGDGGVCGRSEEVSEKVLIPQSSAKLIDEDLRWVPPWLPSVMNWSKRRIFFHPCERRSSMEASSWGFATNLRTPKARAQMVSTVPISRFIDFEDSRSIGAVAGLALAIFFTWRMMRSPSGSQPRQRKRLATMPGNSGVSAPSNAPVIPSGVCSSSDDASAQNAVDEFFQPVKPTLGQIVRQKLSEGRKITCRLLGVILEENSPEELQKQATVRSSVLEVLLEITKFCDLYLMERVLDDESEKRVLVALEDAGVFTSGGLIKDKVLFCSTENGRSSFVRQLEPDWHIDTNPEVITQLARFIKYQLHVAPFRTERTAANVFSASSLEHFFGSI